MKALLIGVDGTAAVVEQNGLEDLQQLVGGPIQALPHSPGVVGYVHEEGKPRGLPENFAATFAFAGILFGLDFIAGPCVLAGFNPDTGEDIDAPERVLRCAEPELVR